MSGPDAPTEDDSERDGFLSYASEYHAAAIGSATGLLLALTYATQYQEVGIVAVVAVTATALGLEIAKPISKKVAREVSKEPWYALGSMVTISLLGFLLRFAL